MLGAYLVTVSMSRLSTFASQYACYVECIPALDSFSKWISSCVWGGKIMYAVNNLVAVTAWCTGWVVRHWMWQWFRSVLACTPYLELCTNQTWEATSSPGYWSTISQANSDSKEALLVQYKVVVFVWNTNCVLIIFCLLLCHNIRNTLKLTYNRIPRDMNRFQFLTISVDTDIYF